MAYTVRVRVTQFITHLGVNYAPGADLDLDPAQLGQLIAAKVVELIAPAPVVPVKPAAPALAKGREA
jgi:hypothetical protein